MAAPGRNNGKPRGARPVDEVADERGLIAVGQAVDDPCRGRLVRKQWAAERVGLDGDVDHMFAVGERGENVLDRRRRIAGALDHDFDVRMRHQSFPVVGDKRVAVTQRVVERGRRRPHVLPAHSLEVGARVRGVEIGDRRQMHTRGVRHLGQVHRAELARADEADAHRLAGSGPLLQFRVEVHVKRPLSKDRSIPRPACRFSTASRRDSP